MPPGVAALTEAHFEPLEQLRAITDEVLLAFSCGKDSVVCLDLLHAYGFRITAFLHEFIPHFSLKDSYIATMRARYGHFDVVRVPSPSRVSAQREGMYCVPQPNLPAIRFRDVWEYARLQTGVRWIATGEKKVDSLERRAMTSRWGAVQPGRRHVRPLSEWNDKQVVAYMAARGIPLSPEYVIFGESLTHPCYPQQIVTLREELPDDYAKLKRELPLVDACYMRAKQLQANGSKWFERGARTRIVQRYAQEYGATFDGVASAAPLASVPEGDVE